MTRVVVPRGRFPLSDAADGRRRAHLGGAILGGHPLVPLGGIAERRQRVFKSILRQSKTSITRAVVPVEAGPTERRSSSPAVVLLGPCGGGGAVATPCTRKAGRRARHRVGAALRRHEQHQQGQSQQTRSQALQRTSHAALLGRRGDTVITHEQNVASDRPYAVENGNLAAKGRCCNKPDATACGRSMLSIRQGRGSRLASLG